MKAWELLSKSGSWCQDQYARDKYHRFKRPDSDDACCWCLTGAIMKCYGESEYSERIRPKLRVHLGMSPVYWNDEPSRTREEVVSLLKDLDL